MLTLEGETMLLRETETMLRSKDVISSMLMYNTFSCVGYHSLTKQKYIFFGFTLLYY